MNYLSIVLYIIAFVSLIATLYFTYLSVIWSKKRHVITHEINAYFYAFCAFMCLVIVFVIYKWSYRWV
jgi:hypothetical protein